MFQIAKWNMMCMTDDDEFSRVRECFTNYVALVLLFLLL